MKRSTIALSVLVAMTACAPKEQAVSSNLNTVTVAGQAYDVFHDPYEPTYAIIFGTHPVGAFDFPKAEIVAEATPCVFDRQSGIAFKATDMQHPTRPELKNLGWVPLNCASA